MNYLSKILFSYLNKTLSRKTFYFNTSYIVLLATIIPILLLIVGAVISAINARRHSALDNTNTDDTKNSVGINEVKKENSIPMEQQNISNDNNTQKNNATQLKDNPSPYDNIKNKSINQSVNTGLPSEQKSIT